MLTPSSGSPLEEPDLVSRADTALSKLWIVEPSCLVPRRELDQLSERVSNTILEARVPSTRRLYGQKWQVFSSWCLARRLDPCSCDVSHVLTFLQELLDKGRVPSTLKVYVAAIAANHSLKAGRSLGRNHFIVKFLKGAQRLNPPRPQMIPSWDLSTVLRALKGSPFEPLTSADLRPLSLKMALTGTVSQCLMSGVWDNRLKSCLETETWLPFWCSALQKSEQLFVCFGGRQKGLLVSKQRLFHWIVDVIVLGYAAVGLQCPIGVRAHSTRGMASSWVLSSGISIDKICAATGW
ncbi:hypothetical protein H4Q32_022366 [Labeo rohita]|uniref:Core-binding (CB) domain-containing protein n=1 Tax=Labeo rohita TaxID=84645 RepID=A0ABQ8MAB4_LABRO|nr:hypothetical protein H4Q32_022366 [Labeo rohita]